MEPLAAFKTFPKEAFAHQGLGDGYVAAGQVPEARRSYQQAMQLSPDAEINHKLERLNQAGK